MTSIKNTDRRSSPDIAVWFFIGATFAFVAAVFVFNTNFFIGLAATILGFALMVFGFIRLRVEIAARRRHH